MSMSSDSSSLGSRTRSTATTLGTEMKAASGNLPNDNQMRKAMDTLVQTYNPNILTGAAAWLSPTSVLTPRFLKISAQIDF